MDFLPFPINVLNYIDFSNAKHPNAKQFNIAFLG